MTQSVAIRTTDRVVVLTGAGISAESGLRTFRDSDGLWEKHRVEDVASPAGWAADPEMVWRFYSARREQARACDPNPAHKALAELEDRIAERLFLVTQNVDDLHERAGSKIVLHMHGELTKSRCENPRCTTQPFEDDRLYPTLADIPRCNCGGLLRPHIVWFGEEPFEMDRIHRAIYRCDLFVVIGSSGSVYPAAGYVREIAYRRERGESVQAIYVGPEPPLNASSFTDIRLGKAGDLLPTLFTPD